ncbi:hypothetical protein SCA6_000948 [Theobroma cacao]
MCISNAWSVIIEGAITFDVKYERLLEEQNWNINELRMAINSHANDAKLHIIVDGVMAHHDEIFRLNSNYLAKTLYTGSLGSSGSFGNAINYIGKMAMADNLRQQMLQQKHRILITHQSAHALLAIHDFFSRLRALSFLWLAQPRE